MAQSKRMESGAPKMAGRGRTTKNNKKADCKAEQEAEKAEAKARREAEKAEARKQKAKQEVEKAEAKKAKAEARRKAEQEAEKAEARKRQAEREVDKRIQAKVAKRQDPRNFKSNHAKPFVFQSDQNSKNFLPFDIWRERAWKAGTP